MQHRRLTLLSSLAASTFLLVFSSTPTLAVRGVEAADIFDQLKSLEGIWKGEAQQISGPVEEGYTDAVHSVTHEFRVSAAGSVVMEVMGAGSDHEMINMIHLDGDDLVLTHYCAAGNQPSMRLNRSDSSKENLVFDFTGGTNLNPHVDPHIHNSEIMLLGEDSLESLWTSYDKGKKSAVMRFTLKRAEE